MEMASRLFQSIVLQMKDTVDRTIGIVDASGAVVACTDLPRIGEMREEAITELGKPFTINEGDGAFYGPKIDIKVKDAIGRTWQCSTVQVDFNMPERFELTYRTEDNTEERPWMLHRAIFGSIERFLGMYGEKAVALGCDFDGCDQLPVGIDGLGDMDKLANRMLALGYRQDVVDGLFYQNAYAFLQKML